MSAKCIFFKCKIGLMPEITDKSQFWPTGQPFTSLRNIGAEIKSTWWHHRESNMQVYCILYLALLPICGITFFVNLTKCSSHFNCICGICSVELY